MEIIVKNKVPIVITSLGARKDINNAVHSYGGIVFHDVTTNTFAKKAIEKGADGLVAVAAGAGGHAGEQSPFALMQEIREWYDGPVALSGAISNGVGIAAAQKLGADLAYIGSPFIATHEANASYDYKQMIVDSTAEDIVYTDYFTGIKGNYFARGPAQRREARVPGDPAHGRGAAHRAVRLEVEECARGLLFCHGALLGCF